MRMSKLLLATLLIGTSLRAEFKSALPLKAAASEPSASPKGELEMKPSWTPSDNHFFLLNHGELGFALTPTAYVGYQQEFTNEIAQEESSSRGSIYLNDGFLRGKLNDIWKSKSGRSKFGIETRIYLPTDSTKADKGMLFAFRNYFKLILQNRMGFSITFMEVPIHHFYSSDGVVTPSNSYRIPDKAAANPTFENRIYIVMGYSTPKGEWDFSLPVIWSATKYRDFLVDAENNDEWSHAILLVPELTYGISKQVRLGIEYESGNLTKLQNTDPEVESSPGSGTFRFIVRANF